VFGRYSVAIVTPFKEGSDGSQVQPLDEESIADVVKHVAQGLANLRRKYLRSVGGVIASGSTGEQHLMSVEEKIVLYRKCVEHCRPLDVPVIAGIAACTTAEACKLAQEAVSIGCQGIMLGLPPYLKLCDSEIKEYVIAIRAVVPSAAEFPILLYNNVARNGYGPSEDLIIDLYQSQLVFGMKYALASENEFIRNAIQLKLRAPDLKLYTGGDKLAASLLPKEQPATVRQSNTATSSTTGAQVLVPDLYTKLTTLLLANNNNNNNNSSNNCQQEDLSPSSPLSPAAVELPLFYGLTSILGNIVPEEVGEAVMRLTEQVPASITSSSSSSSSPSSSSSVVAVIESTGAVPTTTTSTSTNRDARQLCITSSVAEAWQMYDRRLFPLNNAVLVGCTLPVGVKYAMKAHNILKQSVCCRRPIGGAEAMSEEQKKSIEKLIVKTYSSSSASSANP